MSILIFQTSTAPFIRQVARALHEAGLLDRFYTALRDDPSSAWQRALAKHTVGHSLERLATALGLRARAFDPLP